MTEKTFPRLCETYREHRLSNGLRIFSIYKPEFSKLHALLLFNVGSADFNFTDRGTLHTQPAGVAHYLEHKTFDLPEGNASERFSDLGATDNAFTTYDRTAYFFDTADHAEECLSLLLKMAFTPWFTEQSVEKEREIIAQEIRMYEDSPGSKVYENLLAAMFRTHPIREPIAGTLESIEAITPEILQTCSDAFYCPSNAVLCVEGNLSPDRVVAIAEANTPKEVRAPGAPDCGKPEPPVHGGETVQEMDVSMPTFLLGVRCCDRTGGPLRLDMAEDLACDLLCGDSSELYAELYEENLIDGDFYIETEELRGVRLLTVGGDSEDPAAVRDRIFAEAARLCRDGIDPATLARLKKAAVGSRIRSLDSFHSTCFRLASCALDGQEYFDFTAACEEVTAEDVLNVLRCVVPERATLSVILPRKEDEPNETI